MDQDVLVKVTLQIAEKLREIATRQGRVPFKTGWMRKAHRTERAGQVGARMTVDTPYARAVHDGRPALVILPRKGKALFWKGAQHPVRRVSQPARRGRPWITQSIQDLDREGLGWLAPMIGEAAVRDLERQIRSAHLITRRL
jgi:hypothetical protein